MMNSDLLMIILMIMMKTRKKKRKKRIVRLKKLDIGHNVIDLIKQQQLLRRRHGNVAVNLLFLLLLVPDIEKIIRFKVVLVQGLVLVVLVLGFLWKLLFQKAAVLLPLVVKRDRKLRLGLEDLVLILASNLQV